MFCFLFVLAFHFNQKCCNWYFLHISLGISTRVLCIICLGGKVDEMKEICIFRFSRYCQIVLQTMFNSITAYSIDYSLVHICFYQIFYILQNFSLKLYLMWFSQIVKEEREPFIYPLPIFFWEFCVCVVYLFVSIFKNFGLQFFCYILGKSTLPTLCHICLPCSWNHLCNITLNLNRAGFILYSIVCAFVSYSFSRL